MVNVLGAAPISVLIVEDNRDECFDPLNPLSPGKTECSRLFSGKKSHLKGGFRSLGITAVSRVAAACFQNSCRITRFI